MSELGELFARNEAWAAARISEDPACFTRHEARQTPDTLWIGCSDSRVPPNLITGSQPGEMFVHRNIANLVHAGDLNLVSVLEYAIRELKVRHVVVCGHYGCGGVAAAVDGCPHGTIDHWIQPIRDVAARHEGELATIAERTARLRRLSELNVEAQVEALCRMPAVRAAWVEGRDLHVHGWIYDLHDGRLRDLNCSRLPPERR